MHRFVLLTVLLSHAALAEAQEASVRPPNWKLPTLGGKQYWADHLILRDYRIQHHALTKHYRLLDPQNRRLAWGSWRHCRAKLRSIEVQENLQPHRGEVVLVLHGLFSNRERMEKLCDYLRYEGDYEVIAMGYPTTHGTIGQHAQSLAHVVANLGDEVEQIHFVCHSMGNLVLRHYLADQTDPEKGQTPDSRIARIVMLAPPNQGAELAERLIPLDVTGLVAGDAGVELARFQQLEEKLIIPTQEFGILAGRTPKGSNPLLSGEDDLMVRVAATRLPGARDFRCLDVLHAQFMNDRRVQEYTLTFLEHGYFETEALRAPIPADATRPARHLETKSRKSSASDRSTQFSIGPMR